MRLRDDAKTPDYCHLTLESVSGNPCASDAIKSTIRVVSDRDISPKSQCNHIGCIYNQGDMLARRARHEVAIKHINSILHPASSSAARHGPSATVFTLSPRYSHRTILDSGASRHLEAVKSRLTHLHPCYPITLQGISGAPVRIAIEGSAGNCHNVLFSPEATASVRSVSSLLDSHPTDILFDRTSAYLVPTASLPDAAIRIASRKEDGLFHIIEGAVPVTNATSTSSSLLSVAQQIKREQVHRLHRVLGHASPQRMATTLKHNADLAPSLHPRDMRLFTTCDACSIGNAKRTPAPPRAASRSTAFAYRLHADTSGTVRPSTASGFTRVLVAVDDASRWIFVSLLKKATIQEVSSALRTVFRNAAGSESVLRTKCLRCDNGTEFKNTLVDKLVAECDMRREFTCVGTSHQNGVAERAIGILFSMARTMLVDASLPPRFWGEAIMASAHVRNRLPCSANTDNASPFEVRYSSRPCLRHLHPFGVTAFVRIKSHLTKVMPRVIRGIFIGYGQSISGQKGWRVLLANKKVCTTTDVTFEKTIVSSVSRRDRSLVSSQGFTIGPTDGAIPPTSGTPDTELPASLQLNQQRDSLPQQRTTALPPHTHDAAEPTTTHPRTRAQTRTGDHADTITNPTAIGYADGLETAVPVRRTRPRGRPPANSRWDANVGQYVPALASMSSSPSHVAWNLIAARVSPQGTPTTYNEAITCDDAVHWKAAIKQELDSLRRNGTWVRVNRANMPASAVAIKTKWVFKIKRDTNGRIVRYKARLTACGYAQRRGRDYGETFSPVASAASIRFLFAFTACMGLVMSQHDIDTAFLYGTLPEDQRVYLRIPSGVSAPDGTVLACLKAIYGLKQAPRLFNEHLKSAIRSLGYKQALSDPCVFFYVKGNEYSILAVVVDDILHAASSKALVQRFSSAMDKTYRMKHLGAPRLMVGIRITFTPDAIFLDQAHYIREVAERFGQLDAVKTETPACVNGCLGAGSPGDSTPLDPATHAYMSLLGSLLWMSLTRPDVATCISRACQHSVAPTLSHWRAAIRILRYLLTTSSLSLRYRRNNRPPAVLTFVDAGFANESGKRSRYGFAVFVGQCLVCWATKATSMVCLSTAESEFVAATEAVKDVLWLRGLLSELGFIHATPSIVFEDNQSCVAMVRNHIVSGRNRHFCVKMAWLRSQVNQRHVEFRFVASKNNLADIFTKVLPAETFCRLRDALLKGVHSAAYTTHL